MSDRGDFVIHQVEETRRQFPPGCGIEPPDQHFHINDDELFDELVERLELTENQIAPRRLALSSVGARPPVYVFGGTRRRDINPAKRRK